KNRLEPEIYEKYKDYLALDSKVWYEVADGQQRLTTIKLILLFGALTRRATSDQHYSLFYETRPELHEYFNTFTSEVDLSGYLINIIAEEPTNIDAAYIREGLESILEWFTKPAEGENRCSIQKASIFLDNLHNERLEEYENVVSKPVQVLWYELKDGNDARTIFNRINDTKIELTNSELIRALFLSDTSDFGERNRDKDILQAHIREQWDLIEQSLSEERFWSFITGYQDETPYICRIEFLFDLISGKLESDSKGVKAKDPKYTYKYFDKELKKAKTGLSELITKKEGLWGLWQKIENDFYTLKSWMDRKKDEQKDKEILSFYHRVGFLVQRKGKGYLATILKRANTLDRKVFAQKLIEDIRDVIKCDDITELSYTGNYDHLKQILILFNIESSLLSREVFPFEKFYGTNWSLEHIHAQNSEGLPRDNEKAWKAWLTSNEAALSKFLKSREDDEDLKYLINKIREELKQAKTSYNAIMSLSIEVANYFAAFNKKADKPIELHQISNLALLGGPENSALSNTVFEVKRQMIMQWDASGSFFIPLCTKRIFYKQYNINENDFVTQQNFFWGDIDKTNYQKELAMVLKPFLSDYN
ncbi:MAG: DUF262 domain-containing protein, partial [Spirochaetales bacterium]|nr:DUF262 domain-containing protein [Spirochaetales bacterium]